MVFLELAERAGQPLFNLLGERLFAVGPVKRQEFGQLVSALDHAAERWRDRKAIRVARQLAHQQQRGVPQALLFTRFNGEFSDFVRFALRHQLLDAVADALARLVKTILPQQAGQHRAP